MSGIELVAKVFPLAFILYLFPPSVSIDGAPPVKIKWGSNPVPLAPGQHQVHVWFSYLFLKQANAASMVVDVPASGSVRVVYKSRWLVFLPGKIAVEGPPAVAPGAAQPQAPAAVGGAPAGWQSDPSGRFEQRYWDGNAWTEHVSTGGVASSDPVG